MSEALFQDPAVIKVIRRPRTSPKRSPSLAPSRSEKGAREPDPSIDPVDRERIFLAIRNVLKDEQIDALTDVGAGVSQAELAAESGLSQAAKHKEFQRLREKVRRLPRASWGGSRRWRAVASGGPRGVGLGSRCQPPLASRGSLRPWTLSRESRMTPR